MNTNTKKIMKELKSGLLGLYRQRLKGLLLFGSYARGEEAVDSDLDVGLILDEFVDIGKEIENTGEVVSKLSLQNNMVISLHPFREKDLANKKTPFILNIKKEGVRF